MSSKQHLETYSSPECYPHFKDERLMMLTGQWGQAAMNLWVTLNPSVQWANKIVEPYRGLPFGPYLHTARPTRPRALTAPLPSDDSIWRKLQVFSTVESEQHTYDQQQSAFLARLPLDVRMIIYEMVLGGMTFHLSAGDQHSRILHYVCKVPHRIDEQIHDQCHDYSATQRPSSSGSSSSSNRGDEATGLLPLLVTCRKVYSEAVSTLYSSNVFEFTQNFAAFRFLKSMLPPDRLHSIRHFRLFMRIPRHPDANSNSHRDWIDLWDFFENDMVGLMTLHLRLGMLEPMEQRIRETTDAAGYAWIEPMVLMAMATNRKRGCKVEIVTGQANLVTELVTVFRHTAYDNSHLDFQQILKLVCVRVHERIRFSMGGLG